MKFNGSDYDPAMDDKRLTKQHIRIRNLMLDKKWRTLGEISSETSDPEASVSAQLRHLRKKRFGSFVLEKRPSGKRENGLFEYRLMPPNHDSEYVVVERVNKQRAALEAIWKHKDTTPKQKELIRSFFKGNK